MKSGNRSPRTLLAAAAVALVALTAQTATAAPALSRRAAPAKAKAVAVERRSDTALEAAAHRGHALLARGDRAGALRAFETATTLAPTNTKLWRLVGDLRYSLDRVPDALDAWERAAAISPWDDAIVERLARGSVRLGDYERAAAAEGRLTELLARASESHPEVARADVGFGQASTYGAAYRDHLGILSELAVLAGDFTTAEQAARKLMAAAPDAVDGRLALAYVHLHAAELDDAESLYREVLGVSPDNSTALNNLGNILYLRRDFDGAAELFERIVELGGEGGATPYSQSIAYANLGELLQIQSAFKDARGLYQQAIDLQPKGAWGYMGMAALLDVTGDHDGATSAMIDGWERDRNRLSRLNMHFYKDEWAWQRDALIAEVEGDVDLAAELWSKIAAGDVPMLSKSAYWHLRALASEAR